MLLHPDAASRTGPLNPCFILTTQSSDSRLPAASCLVPIARRLIIALLLSCLSYHLSPVLIWLNKLHSAKLNDYPAGEDSSMHRRCGGCKAGRWNLLPGANNSVTVTGLGLP